MKFSTREDIEAPVEAVFRAVSDFDAFERQLLKRGVDVVRDDSVSEAGPGLRWQLDLTWRERPHKVAAELVSFEPGQGYAIESTGSGIACLAVVDLVALSKRRTRLFVSADLKPQTLSARLLIQSLKLAKSSLSRRFEARVKELAGAIETRENRIA